MGDFFSNLVAGLQNAFSFGDLSVVRILLTLGLAFLIGMYIFAIYRKPSAVLCTPRISGFRWSCWR